MTALELRRLFIDFFVEKHGHAEIPGASLIPENDPTVLFTTAGMHPLVPYLMGETHPSGVKLVDVQKCLRTDDIDEVGDPTHLTYFEMLGNWSLGDYFKKEAVEMSYEFMTSSREDGGLELPVSHLAVSCFEGDDDAPRDEDSAEVWRSLGIAEERIAFLDKKENWWGPAGQTGPCGADSEMFFWTGDLADGSEEPPAKFDPEDERWVEIWNDVFMQYYKNEDGTYRELEQKNVDTGMGFERVLCILNGVSTPFETDLFMDVVEAVRSLGGYDVGKAEPSEEQMLSERIICDHLRAATFLIGDRNGVTPSNTDQGYILRRLIRRAIRHGRKLGIEGEFARKLAGIFVNLYGETYPELIDSQEKIYEELAREEEQFGKTLEKGLRELSKRDEGEMLNGEFAFYMYETYGFPVEMTLEEVRKDKALAGKLDEEKFMKEFAAKEAEHQKKSRLGAEAKFSGGLADDSEAVTRLHTATHLLHQALRTVLGEHVQQKGSNITADRLRFDFTHEEKMTDEEKAEVEKLVNEQIEADLPVHCEEMSVGDAKKSGALGFFESKYGDVVKVYTVGRAGSSEAGGHFSKEICGGPHVERLGELGAFKIKKEESSSRGVRRIKGILG
ncbi:alanine--tRNA ligase [Candidatus Peregrinibacteria bacterium]|nr:alanine--tRNA ligase [Candidatus Peregrinibacteria bacterium]MBT4055570.1 alanine--tRNA ligase [Candidatus Peregrinibacteria bacterium]